MAGFCAEQLTCRSTAGQATHVTELVLMGGGEL